MKRRNFVKRVLAALAVIPGLGFLSAKEEKSQKISDEEVIKLWANYALSTLDPEIVAIAERAKKLRPPNA